MEFMPTNDVFHHLCNLFQLNDNEKLVAIFAAQGMEVTKSKIKSWKTKTGNNGRDYRPMPRHALDVFLSELYANDGWLYD